MDAIVAYFSGIPSSHRALILVGGITFFWVWESAAPLFRFEYRKWSHALLNIFFTATTIVVNFGLAFILLQAADWTVANRFGLLFLLPTGSLVLQLVVGLLVLDLISAWLAHWVQHKTPLMWRLHLIHHSDTHIDTTSANRHHPGESVVRFVFTTLGVLVVGAPMWMVLLYQAVSVVLSQFNHANITLPPALDRALSWVIVSPGHAQGAPPLRAAVHRLQLRQRLLGVGPALRHLHVAGARAPGLRDRHAHGSRRSTRRSGALLTMPFRPYRKPSAPEPRVRWRFTSGHSVRRTL